MSRDATIELDWADGEHRFRLGWGELIKLQEACDAGPLVIFGRLGSGTWRLNDIRETMRLGLIGGGKTPDAALALVRDYVEARPPMENVALARAILGAAVLGPADEAPGEAFAASETESA